MFGERLRRASRLLIAGHSQPIWEKRNKNTETFTALLTAILSLELGPSVCAHVYVRVCFWQSWQYVNPPEEPSSVAQMVVLQTGNYN